MYTYIYLNRTRKSERQPKVVQSKGGGGVGMRASKGGGGDKGGGEKTKLVRGVEAKVTVYDLRNAYLPKKTDIGLLHLRKRALYLRKRTHFCYCYKHVKRAHTHTDTHTHTHHKFMRQALRATGWRRPKRFLIIIDRSISAKMRS